MNSFLCGTSGATDLPVHRRAYLFLFRRGVEEALKGEEASCCTRRERILRIKREVAGGRYRIDAKRVAQRLLVLVAVKGERVAPGGQNGG